MASLTQWSKLWELAQTPSSLWCHPTISSSVIPYSSCLQSSPASGSFAMSQFFPSGGPSIGVSASTSVLPMYIQLISFRTDWLDLLEVQGTLKSLFQHHSSKASVPPMSIQGWFPLGMTGLISLLSKEVSRVFSSTTISKHQFFSTQPSLWSNSHIHTWLLEKSDYTDLCQQSNVSDL